MPIISNQFYLFLAGVGALIEIWKVTKALHIEFSFRSGFTYGSDTAGEASTAQLDQTAMKYLSWVLYPLCLGLKIKFLTIRNCKQNIFINFLEDFFGFKRGSHP